MNAGHGLEGRSILVTRPHPWGRSLVDALRARGANPIWIPAITLTETSPARLREAARALQEVDWLVLSSPTSIRILCDCIDSLPEPVSWPRCAVLGEASARILKSRSNQEAALIYDFRGRCGLARQMNLKSEERVLILRSNQEAGPVLADFKRQHARLRELAISEVQCNCDGIRKALGALAGSVDAAVFTSPSGVECFLKAVRAGSDLPPWLLRCCIGCLGSTTAGAVTAAGLQADVVADSPDMPDLIHRMAQWFRQRAMI